MLDGVGCLCLSVCLFLCPLSILFCSEHQIHTICSQWTKRGMIAIPDSKLWHSANSNSCKMAPGVLSGTSNPLFGPGEPDVVLLIIFPPQFCLRHQIHTVWLRKFRLGMLVDPHPKLCIWTFFGTQAILTLSKWPPKFQFFLSIKSTVFDQEGHGSRVW